jgi:hypothetical protein
VAVHYRRENDGDNAEGVGPSKRSLSANQIKSADAVGRAFFPFL